MEVPHNEEQDAQENRNDHGFGAWSSFLIFFFLTIFSGSAVYGISMFADKWEREKPGYELQQSQWRLEQSERKYLQTQERLKQVDNAISFLEHEKSKNPERADAAVKRCWAPGEDVSVTLNCVQRVLGN